MLLLFEEVECAFSHERVRWILRVVKPSDEDLLFWVPPEVFVLVDPRRAEDSVGSTSDILEIG